MTDTSQQIPGDLPGHRSNWQGGVGEKAPSTKSFVDQEISVPDPWGEHLSDERALGDSPVPLVLQRRKTISV